MPEALRRAQDDLAAGRPWKARERLRSYVNAYPTDAKALEVRAPLESWPPLVQQRLRELGAEAEPRAAPPRPPHSTIVDKVALAGCLAGLIAFAVFAIIGLVLTVDRVL